MSFHDLLGRELAVGDHVVYPTGHGSDKKVCVAEITEIIVPGTTRPRYDRETCTTNAEPVWSVRVQPKVFNDYRARARWGYRDGEYQKIAEVKPKAVVLKNVENLVKVELPDG